MIREPMVEGIFYPDNKEELKIRLKKMLTGPNPSSQASDSAGKKYRGMILPHAAWSYCEETLTAGFQSLETADIHQVVLLSLVHREQEKQICLSESKQFKTPLGTIDIDQELNDRLVSDSSIAVKNDIPHLEEHSLEVLLPFIQYLLPEAKILPILMGSADAVTVKGTAKLLRNGFLQENGCIDGNTVIIISGNLCEFSPAPLAQEQADLFVALAEKGSPDLIEQYRQKKVTACAAPPLAALQKTVGITAELIHRSCSPTEGGNQDVNAAKKEKKVCYGALGLVFQ